MGNSRISGLVGNLEGNVFNPSMIDRISDDDLMLVLNEFNNRQIKEKYKSTVSKYKKLIMKKLDNSSSPLEISEINYKYNQRLILFDIENIGKDDLKFAKNLSYHDTLVVFYHKNNSNKLLKDYLNKLKIPCKLVYRELDLEEKEVVDFRYYFICSILSDLNDNLDIIIISKDFGFHIFNIVNDLNISIYYSLESIRPHNFITPFYKNLDTLINMEPSDMRIELKTNLKNYLVDTNYYNLIVNTKIEISKLIFSQVKLSEENILDICNILGLNINISSEYNPVENKK